MPQLMQRTIVGNVDLVGICIQTGEATKWTVTSAPENFGIKFIRTEGDKILDVIQADHNSVSETNGLVVLKGRQSRVCGIEHLLSIFHGIGITNATVVCPTTYPPENSLLFTKLLMDKITLQREEVCYFRMPDTYYHDSELGTTVEIKAADRFTVYCCFEFVSPSTPTALKYSLTITPQSYRDKISPARTFCTAKRLSMLQSNRNALGVYSSNCLVIPNEEVLSGIDMTELARHKILDFIGDIYLIGSSVLGDFRLFNPSHTATNKFIGYLLNG